MENDSASTDGSKTSVSEGGLQRAQIKPELCLCNMDGGLIIWVTQNCPAQNMAIRRTYALYTRNEYSTKSDSDVVGGFYYSSY